MTNTGNFELISSSPAHTDHIGHNLGALLQQGDVICLSGELGAGKTALTRGIVAGWGSAQRVTSPTFVLIHEHSRGQDDDRLHHIDCYRLSGSDEAAAIGLEDMLDDDSITVIEWAEHINDMLPEDRLWVRLDAIDDHQRHIALHARGERFTRLLHDLRDRLAPETDE